MPDNTGVVGIAALDAEPNVRSIVAEPVVINRRWRSWLLRRCPSSGLIPHGIILTLNR